MPNHLAPETSPYLRQHADNPVDWYPWSAEALALARRGNRPILLSVGYSACHWCHVMAHECFEDAQTAALMNRYFVCIKVDREERPDIDQIYQTAHQLIARRPGGWPLTMFLTPDAKPFYGGTYFPKRSRYNLIGFDDLLQRVAQVWEAQREQVIAQGNELVRALASTTPALDHGAAAADPGGPDDADGALAAAAPHAAGGLRDAMMLEFDSTHGGFGAAPKFPQPSSLDALLRHAVATRDTAARDAVLLTLRRMAEGGLYDHLGGGFFRYSTDARWMIPHFEKMLYDNGALLRLYAQAWQLTREPLFREVCEGTAAWLMREMQARDASGGGYLSSLDADSEGVEGRFYVWQRDAVAKTLEPAEFAAFAARYGLDAAPNFEGHAWHLYAAAPLAEVAQTLGRTQADCETLLTNARERLFAQREGRARPGRDDKVLTAWNALAIEGMACAARVFGEPRWAESARRALDFMVGSLWRDGRLLATAKDGRSHLNAYLDDHAFLLAALLELMQGKLQTGDLQFARALADAMLEHFEDAHDGGFFFTRHDHETLVLRPKSGHDGATPSGNGMTALHLQRFGHLLGEPRYLDAARRTLALFAAEAQRVPHGFATLIGALTEYAAPPTVVVLTGPADACAAWRAELDRAYLPSTLLLQSSGADDGAGLPASLAKPFGAVAQAWVCRGPQCLPPITDIESLIGTLSGPAQ